MSSPATLTNHGYNFYCPVIGINKIGRCADSGNLFLKEISRLLGEFGVSTAKISERPEKVNKSGDLAYRLRLILSDKPENLINLYGKVGFEYNQKRRFLANVAVQYLKVKQNIIETKNTVALKAIALKQGKGMSASEIYEELGSAAPNLRFIERSIYEGRMSSPRIGIGNLSFEEFLKHATEGLGDSGMVWDEIADIEEVKFNGYVYDFTVEHPHHNFIANNFVVSNCGVRLMRTNLTLDDVKPRIRELVPALFRDIPCGVGVGGNIKISWQEEKKVFLQGSKWAIKAGFGAQEDLEHTESGGCLDGADPDKASPRSYERGKGQVGTLGSGNHFVEVQVIDEIYDETAADVFGLKKNQITVMIHSGSRGFGYQICDDYIKELAPALGKYKISIPDRQLVCAPVNSPEGQAYFAAMKCAANYAWANRQVLMHLTREIFEKFFNMSPKDLGMDLIYDVAHNIAKMEKHKVDGKEKLLCVHRKGATRAFPPNHPEIPLKYKALGQPVIIPGDMGRNSYLLLGTESAAETWYSTCHGAGRVMSRGEAIRRAHGRSIQKELEAKGIIAMARGREGLAEEQPDAYKDVNEVVGVVDGAGLSKKVCRMRPLGVIKG
ncbi:MAG: RtcB family protein [Candidatus Omnitrophota bacterium]